MSKIWCANKKPLFQINTFSDTKVQLYINKPAVKFFQKFSTYVEEREPTR